MFFLISLAATFLAFYTMFIFIIKKKPLFVVIYIALFLLALNSEKIFLDILVIGISLSDVVNVVILLISAFGAIIGHKNLKKSKSVFQLAADDTEDKNKK